MASFGNAILSFGDTVVRQSEIDILTMKESWLNDIIIGFYLEYLGDQYKEFGNKVRLYAPGLTQFVKMVSDLAEIPILLGDPHPKDIQYAFWVLSDSIAVGKGVSGTHWSLLVFSRPDNAFLHYGSFPGFNRNQAGRIFKNLAPLFSISSSLCEITSCHPQGNHYDCGLHALGNARIILETIRIRIKSEKRATQLLTTVVPTISAGEAELLRPILVNLIRKLGSEQSAKEKEKGC